MKISRLFFVSTRCQINLNESAHSLCPLLLAVRRSLSTIQQESGGTKSLFR